VPEYSVKCECRKPRPGMINMLAERYKIDKKNSVIVGDKTTDVQAGDNAGLIKSFLISGAYHGSGNVERFLEVTKFLKE
jgi:D-glycero-D-manno-heptose 1,7-bisphosphate phosphatase